MEDKTKYKYTVVDEKTHTFKKEGTFETEFTVEEVRGAIKALETKFREIEGSLKFNDIKLKNYRKANKRVATMLEKFNIAQVKDYVDTEVFVGQLREDRKKIQESIQELEAELAQVELQTGVKLKEDETKKDDKGPSKENKYAKRG